MCSQTRLRAALGHLRPKSNKPGGLFDGWHLDGAAAVDVEVDESAEFPVGFSAHGPKRDVDPAAARQMGMSAAETEFFKEFGYIVKRGLVPKEELAPWVDKLWETVVPSCCDRSDPSTWVDPQRHPDWGPSPELAAEARAVGRVMRAYPAGFEAGNIRWAKIGGDPEYVRATSGHPNVLRMVQTLLGGPIKRPHRVRGQYVHFPKTSERLDHTPPLYGLGVHNDFQPFECFGFILIDDVEPKSGGT